MGEAADDLIDGVCCSLCGAFFEEEHGYPVICNECWNGLSKAERKDYKKATCEVTS